MRKRLLDKLLVKARELPKFVSMPVGDINLTHDEQQYLVGNGVAFNCDRMGKPAIHISTETKINELRAKVIDLQKTKTTY